MAKGWALVIHSHNHEVLFQAPVLIRLLPAAAASYAPEHPCTSSEAVTDSDWVHVPPGLSLFSPCLTVFFCLVIPLNLDNRITLLLQLLVMSIYFKNMQATIHKIYAQELLCYTSNEKLFFCSS